MQDFDAAYQRGKSYGLHARSGKDPKHLRPNSLEMRAVLLEYAQTRDKCKRLARTGNVEAARQAAYLDGFLSVWD